MTQTLRAVPSGGNSAWRRIAARPSLRRARPDAVTEPGSTSHALADHTYRSQGTHAATVDDTKLHRQPVRPGLGGRAGPSCGPPAQATAGGRTAERTPAAAPPSPSTRCPARCARRTAPHVPCRPGRAGGRTGCRAPWPRSRPGARQQDVDEVPQRLDSLAGARGPRSSPVPQPAARTARPGRRRPPW